MLTATRAAVLGIARFTYEIANCISVVGPGGNGYGEAPNVERHPLARASCAMTSATASHHQSASPKASATLDQSTPAIAATIVSVAMSKSATLSNDRPLTRRSRTSAGGWASG